MSAFFDVASLRPLKIREGVLGRSVKGERVTLGVIEFEPGATLHEHRHDNEQVGVLIEGSLSLRVDQETRELGPGGTWCITANVPHAVVAGPAGAVVIEVFAPRRDDWDSLETLEPGRQRWP